MSKTVDEVERIVEDALRARVELTDAFDRWLRWKQHDEPKVVLRPQLEQLRSHLDAINAIDIKSLPQTLATRCEELQQSFGDILAVVDHPDLIDDMGTRLGRMPTPQEIRGLRQRQ